MMKRKWRKNDLASGAVCIMCAVFLSGCYDIGIGDVGLDGGNILPDGPLVCEGDEYPKTTPGGGAFCTRFCEWGDGGPEPETPCDFGDACVFDPAERERYCALRCSTITGSEDCPSGTVCQAASNLFGEEVNACL